MKYLISIFFVMVIGALVAGLFENSIFQIVVGVMTLVAMFLVVKEIDKNESRLRMEKAKKMREALEVEIRSGKLENDFIAGPFAVKKIGGSGYEIEQNQNLNIGITSNSLILVEQLSNPRRVEVSFDEINEIEISGPGKVTSSAGIMGGGFGLEGFLQGAVAAAIINAATTKSSINTFIRILSKKGEVYLHSSSIEPLQLKMELSPIFVKLSSRSKIANFNGGGSIASELEKIQELLKSGVLSQDEFEAAKKKILS